MMKFTENQIILMGGGALVVDSKNEAKVIRKECQSVCKARYGKEYNGKYVIWSDM